MSIRIKFFNESHTIKAVSYSKPPKLKGVVSYKFLACGRYSIIGRRRKL